MSSSSSSDKKYSQKPKNTVWIESSSFKFANPSNWVPVNSSECHEAQQVSTLTIITQNILFDQFEADKLHSATRWQQLFVKLEPFDADIIGFQEVTPSFLDVLLSVDWIRRGYYVSDVSAQHTTPYGQVLISKYPFKVLYHEYSSHKRVIIGTFNFNGRIVHVPVLHLTSDHGKGNLAAKRVSQMTTIYQKTVPESIEYEKDDGSDCIMIGDYNMADGGEGEAASLRPDFADLWKVMNPNDPGYTFDPENNALAMITTKTGLRRRYDRILLRSTGMHWQPLSCVLINTECSEFPGNNGQMVSLPPSDHFGLLSQIQFIDDAETRAQSVLQRNKTLAAEKASADTVASFLMTNNMIESIERIRERNQALARLQLLITAACPQATGLRLLPVGSFALGLQAPDSDVDVLCFSDIPSGDFFVQVSKHLRRESKRQNSNVSNVRVILDAVVPIISVFVGNVCLDLQYAHIREVNISQKNFNLVALLNEAENKNEVRRYFDQSSYLAAQSARAVNMLTELIPNLKVFQQVYLIIRRWANAHGLTSNRLAFIGGHGWTIMLTRVAQLNPRASVMGLLSAFFSTYATWDFRKDPITVLTRPAIGYTHVSKKEPICIITCTAPYKNIARNATHSSRRILIQELQKANSLVALGGNAHEVLQNLWKPVDFFSQHSSYLQVIVSASTFSEYTSWVNQVESRLIQLLLLLESTPVVLAHPCPTRFVHQSSNYPYSAAFYIGLSAIKENVDEKYVRNSGGHLDLSKYITEFTTSMQRWAGFSDTMEITIKQKARGSIKSVVPETSATYSPEYSSDEEEPEEEAQQAEVQEVVEPVPAASSSSAPETSKAAQTSTSASKAANKNQKKSKGSRANVEEEKAAKPRFRTSEACMNWIRHDPRFNPEEFIISYEDRFVGMMDVALKDFTHDQQSEVFIPMHRIWFIKQNGRVVWDRKNRIDILGEAFN